MKYDEDKALAALQELIKGASDEVAPRAQTWMYRMAMTLFLEHGAHTTGTWAVSLVGNTALTAQHEEALTRIIEALKDCMIEEVSP